MDYFLDNDAPSINSSSNFPVEGRDTVTLTCNKATSAADTVKSYKWYKDGVVVLDQISATYNIGANRTASADYRCQVVTTDGRISKESSPKKITFMCK